MATWQELYDHVRARQKLDVELEGEFAVTVERDDAGRIRKQRVMVRRFSAWDREMMEIRSAFGELGDWDPQALLADNLDLPIGAVALHGRYLVLVHKAVLADLTVEGAAFLVTRVSLLADVLEGRLGEDRF